MLAAARLFALIVGIVTIYFVLAGLMRYPEFVVPDLALGALLIAAAIAPARWVTGALIGACGFALGVYCVAVCNQLELGVPVNPPLIGVIAGTLVSLLLTIAAAARREP